MTERRSPSRLAYPFLAALTFLVLSAAGCEQTPVQPAVSPPGTGSAAQMASSGAEVVPLEAVKPGVTGTSTLHRREQGFTVRVSARGLTPRHPVTLWAIALDADLEPVAVGRVAGGIVGGAGSVNLAGNNCVDEDGKSPGTPPVCDLIDPAGNIRLVLLEGEDEWSPGDQSARWMPSGKPPAARAHHLVAP